MNKALKLFTLTAAVAASTASASVVVTIDFDTDLNWTAGSGGITSYQSDHVYSESGWDFTGGPALRQGTAVQDGVAGALGTYSWRLRDQAVTWTATYSDAFVLGEKATGFSFDARRWDGSPATDFTVEYSFDAGSNWTSATSVTDANLGGSSDWKTFSETFASEQTNLGAGDFIVKFTRVTGERIMVDNFTVVPEPSTYAAILGLFTLGFVAYRRRKA